MAIGFQNPPYRANLGRSGHSAILSGKLICNGTVGVRGEAPRGLCPAGFHLSWVVLEHPCPFALGGVDGRALCGFFVAHGVDSPYRAVPLALGALVRLVACVLVGDNGVACAYDVAQLG